MTKVCTWKRPQTHHALESLALSLFGSNRGKTDGLNPYCKACSRIRAKEWRSKQRPSVPSLLGFIHANGGLDLRGFPGERRAWIENGPGRRPGLLRRSRCALSWEEMLSSASNEGFGPFENQRDFFDAIDNEIRGLRKYTSEVQEPDEAKEWERYRINMTNMGLCALCHRPLENTDDNH